ncbi:MAG: glycoside hydrolase family 31 protein [Hespellia sp.]|nr:glycoside hydrolase family 31 protein [Hespellia sp.]
MEVKKESFGNIMHGLSKTEIVPDEIVFENMPVFPQISRSKGLTMLLVNRLKEYKVYEEKVIFTMEAVYIEEKYTYRYFDYRQVFNPRGNTSTITIAISFINDKTVRVQMEEGFTARENQTEMIADMKREKISPEVYETEDWIELRTTSLVVHINKNPWKLDIRDVNGESFYNQFGRDDHSFMPYEICPMGFLFDEKKKEQYACEAVSNDVYEQFYGIGENFTSVNRTGRAFELWNTNSLGVNTERAYKYIPFYMSSKGYGVFYNTSKKIRIDFGATLSKANSVMVEGKSLDIFVMKGNCVEEILPLYYNITGWPVMPPKWSFGLWISKISYGSRKEVEEVANQLRAKDIPCDVIHIDTDWFAENWICDWKFDEKKFPDVEEMTRNLHKQGFKISLWQLPYIEKGSISHEVYEEAMKKGYFAANQNGNLQFAHGLIDLTNPEAVGWYKNELIKPLLRKGIDVIKADFGESAPAFFKYAGKEGSEMHNLYALLYNKTIYEATKEEKGEENALIWARSAWAGSQKYPVHWGGDSGTDFGSMASSLKGCLNASLSGIPFWSSDIGGFFFESNPVLYTRWSQFGMFCSHARLHGFYTREPWAFGEEVLDIFRQYAKLRYRLIPYIYNYSMKAVREGIPIHRAMMYAFPEDKNTRDLDTQYMFGRDILVAPVLNESGYSEVYLPEGTWTDYHTDEILPGNQWIKRTVPLDIMPIYIRENAILPMGEEMNYVEEHMQDTYEIHLYPRQGVGEFKFYEENVQIIMETDSTKVTLKVNGEKLHFRFIFHHVSIGAVRGNEKYTEFDEQNRKVIELKEMAAEGDTWIELSISGSE